MSEYNVPLQIDPEEIKIYKQFGNPVLALLKAVTTIENEQFYLLHGPADKDKEEARKRVRKSLSEMKKNEAEIEKLLTALEQNMRKKGIAKPSITSLREKCAALFEDIHTIFTHEELTEAELEQSHELASRIADLSSLISQRVIQMW